MTNLLLLLLVPFELVSFLELLLVVDFPFDLDGGFFSAVLLEDGLFTPLTDSSLLLPFAGLGLDSGCSVVLVLATVELLAVAELANCQIRKRAISKILRKSSHCAY